MFISLMQKYKFTSPAILIIFIKMSVRVLISFKCSTARERATMELKLIQLSHSPGSGLELIEGSVEHGNERSNFIKSRECLD